MVLPSAQFQEASKSRRVKKKAGKSFPAMRSVLPKLVVTGLAMYMNLKSCHEFALLILA